MKLSEKPISKQPIERLSYTVNYAEALQENDNIEVVQVTSSPEGLEISSVGVYDPRVKFFVGGGVNGATYKISIVANTADGQIYEDELYMKVKEI